MTDATFFPIAPPARRAVFGAEPLFAATGLLIALSLAVTIAAMAVDPRLFQGESVWIKPIKFQIALALYLLTLAFFARWLPTGMTARRSYRLYAGFVVLAVLAELAWIGGAAMYGTASHFNLSTPTMERLYGLMGFFAVSLTSASLVYGVAIWRNPATGLARPLRLAVALGLVLTFVLTVWVAGAMASMPGHFIGTPLTGATLPILGWSREVGDLRAPHFLATHAMHVLPIAGLIATGVLRERAAIGAVWASAALFAGLVAVAFFGALAGAPLIPQF